MYFPVLCMCFSFLSLVPIDLLMPLRIRGFLLATPCRQTSASPRCLSPRPLPPPPQTTYPAPSHKKKPASRVCFFFSRASFWQNSFVGQCARQASPICLGKALVFLISRPSRLLTQRRAAGAALSIRIRLASPTVHCGTVRHAQTEIISYVFQIRYAIHIPLLIMGTGLWGGRKAGSQYRP